MVLDMVPRNPGSPSVANVMGDWAAGYNMSAVPWSWTFPAYTAYPNANLPDVSVENAAGGFVEPNLASMEAAFSHASFDTMSDLVDFATSATDTTAYPAQMMTPDYLEVPLNGLAADKASTLAGFIDYVLSSKGQSAICSAGYLPVVQSGLDTSACSLPSASGTAAAVSSKIVTADDAVIAELEAEATVPTTTTTAPTGGQVPEAPYLPLLPLVGAGVLGGGLVAYRARHRRGAPH